jgi:hypothetical protein
MSAAAAWAQSRGSGAGPMESPKNGIRSWPRQAIGRKKFRVRQAGRIQKKENRTKKFNPKALFY